MTISFRIPGPPVGKGRPRHTRTGRTYTPAKTKAYEKKVAALFREVYKGKPIDGSVSVVVLAYFQVPKSASKKKRNEMLGKPCLKSPDWDNIGKIVCDALNGIAYHDDRQVAEATVRKVWNDTDYVFVDIKPYNP